MLVPSKEIVVLGFLLIGHLDQIVVKLAEHENICECEVVSNEEGT